MILLAKKYTQKILFLLLLLYCIPVFPQALVIFRDSVFNFDKINETDGITECTFHFKNAGTDSLNIYDVKTSCGCVVTEWDKRKIAPLDSGYIKVTYNPDGIRGHFYKTIRVLSNPGNGENKLYIFGNVLPKDTSYKYNGPFFQIGNVRFSTLKLNMDTILDSEISYDSVLIINEGVHPISMELSYTDSNFSATAVDTLLPQMKAYIRVSYNPTRKNAYGDFFDRFTITTNDSLSPNKSFSVRGFVKEDFLLLSEEDKKNAPLATLDKQVFDMGTLAKDGKTEIEFILTNNGNSDLILRKIKPACGCTVLARNVDKVSPGETEKLQFVFDAKGKSGVQNRKILIITNDPDHPLINLFIKGNILP